MRPPGPLPVTDARSMPRARASLRIGGVVTMWPTAGIGDGRAAGAFGAPPGAPTPGSSEARGAPAPLAGRAAGAFGAPPGAPTPGSSEARAVPDPLAGRAAGAF